MIPIDTPNITDGTANHVYSVVSIADYKSIRREAAAAADQPALLTISHQFSGVDLAHKVSSLVRFERTVEDAAGNQGLVEAYTILRWPDKITTAAIAQKTLNEMIAFWAVSGYKDRITNVEI